ncbi:MAG: NAD(P)-binding domain-containing protein [Dehalococcoidia bacterium]|nr:NAD(P)-binding domain-containing protein [Dehalococcoidia bacterium]
MKLGMVGLGRMGGNMTERLLNDGHEMVVYDPDSSAVESLAEKGASAAASLADLVGQLGAPRTVWVMVPAGDITEQSVNDLVELLASGDTLIDGGNSNYKESQRRGNTRRRVVSISLTQEPVVACGGSPTATA